MKNLSDLLHTHRSEEKFDKRKKMKPKVHFLTPAFFLSYSE